MRFPSGQRPQISTLVLWGMQMTAIKSPAFGGQAGNFYDYFAFRTVTQMDSHYFFFFLIFPGADQVSNLTESDQQDGHRAGGRSAERIRS